MAYNRRSVAHSSGQRRRHRPDYWLLILSTVLLVVGLIIVYAISPGLSVQKHVSENYYVGKQLLAVGLSVITFIVVANMPLRVWKGLEKALIISAIVAALAVRLFGEEVNGAYRWIQLGGLSFQAAELIKLALLIWLAGFLTQRIRNNELDSPQKTFKPLIIALILIGVVVAKLESDLGSTVVMVAMMMAMAFVAGLPMKRIATIGGIIAIGFAIAVSTSSYRRDRFFTFMHPASDCQEAGYQACQALITVGSGGMFGLGLARSVQAYGYLPEAANDSIFAILAEKFGFIGVTVIIFLFGGLFSRIKNIMERAPSNYSRLLVTGILAWLSTQTIINIGAMLGLLPLKGITLPFISYGGTSLLFVTAAIGIVFHISRYTTFSASTINQGLGEESYNDNSPNRRRVRGAYYPAPGSR